MCSFPPGVRGPRGVCGTGQPETSCHQSTPISDQVASLRGEGASHQKHPCRKISRVVNHREPGVGSCCGGRGLWERPLLLSQPVKSCRLRLSHPPPVDVASRSPLNSSPKQPPASGLLPICFHKGMKMETHPSESWGSGPPQKRRVLFSGASGTGISFMLTSDPPKMNITIPGGPGTRRAHNAKPRRLWRLLALSYANTDKEISKW